MSDINNSTARESLNSITTTNRQSAHINDPWKQVRECIGTVDEDISFERNQLPIDQLPQRETI